MCIWNPNLQPFFICQVPEFSILGMHEIISSKQVIWFCECVQDGVLRQRFFRETRSLRTPHVTRTKWLVSFASLANIASNPVLPSMTIKFRRNKRLSPVRLSARFLLSTHGTWNESVNATYAYTWAFASYCSNPQAPVNLGLPGLNFCQKNLRDSGRVSIALSKVYTPVSSHAQEMLTGCVGFTPKLLLPS
jgi:hypothetical protein